MEGSRCTHCGAVGQAGGFTVTGLLAKSGHGRMYLATDAHGAKIALKELVFALVPTIEDLAAFEREAALLKELAHPRIPRFLKAFTEGAGTSTRLYLAQSFVSGESLAARLEHHRFDEPEVMHLAEEALEILAWLHARRPVVLHRDVKPSNLILGPEGALHLVDFGSARDLAGDATHRSTLVGTFGYAAPEQLGGTVEPRSDLYSLGATLIHLLTRKPPDQLLAAGMKSEFARAAQLSVRTERFLARLVAPRPEDRFASAAEALRVLRGESKAAPTRTLAVGVSLAVAAAVGAAFLWATPRPAVEATGVAPPSAVVRAVAAPPVVTAPPVRPAVAPLAEAPGESRPPRSEIRFPWQMATWEFNKPGHWIIDSSGHGHDVRLPERGFTSDFFGLVWDGTGGLRVPGSADFELTVPFSLTLSMMLPKEANTQPAVLIARGDPAGAFAWKVTLEPGRVVRFTVSDAEGNSSTVEAAFSGGVKGSSMSSVSVYANFDPTTGEQSLLGDCKVLAETVTQVRPAKKLPDSDLRLLEGFVGHVSTLQLQKGIWVPSKGAGCGYSLDKLGN